MNPKEKALELVDKFTVVGLQQRNEGHQCALIAVDELIYETFGNGTGRYKYWTEVKQEIEKNKNK